MRLLLLTLFTVCLSAGPAVAEEIYICPPCGGDCDTLLFHAPGQCPGCGMALVNKGEIRDVAILVFDGVEILDFTGPYEAFNSAGGLFRVYTIALDTHLIVTSGGLIVKPHCVLDSAPSPDILVVPGGGVGRVMRDAKIMSYLKRTAAEAEIVLSVCSGSFILAHAGLLDGLMATAHRGDIDELRREAPKSKVVDDRRFVDNGKIICAAGVSSGIDAALYVMERLHGAERARQVETYLEFSRRND